MTREEAIRILSNRDAHGVPCGYTSGYQEAFDMAIEALEELPKRRKEAKRWKHKALQAETVKHGKWVEHDDGTVLCECSECHEKYLVYEEHILGRNFCPNCGAKMDGGVK